MRLGFVILNYERPKQLLRLGKTLVAIFPESQIVCNNDFAQCSLDSSQFDGLITFVDPCVPMKWGDISCIRAALAGLEKLLSLGHFDWCFLISGSTYPVKGREHFEKRLAASDCDAFIHCEEVPAQPVRDSRYTHWEQIQSRYMRHRVTIPAFDAQGKIRRSYRFLRMTRFSKLLLPYGSNCSLHSGGFWFAGNMHVVKSLLQAPDRFQRLYRHAHTTPIPEEMFFHTVIANTANLAWQNDDLHFISWPGMTSNPRFLTMHDLPDISKSNALWARKIRDGEDDGLLDSLDQIVFH